jgi:aryl-alcohol dehydrogenase-like predicted oxidoreductase
MEAQAVSERLGLPRFESYQPQYSLMERQLFEYEAMPFCKHYQVGVIPYSPLARGFLTGKYRRNGPKVQSARAGEMKDYANDKGWALIDALEEIGKSHNKTITQTSLAWMLTNPVITSPIIGANNVEQLKDSLGAAGYRLTPEEIKRLNDLTAWPRNWRPIWD